MKNRVINSHKKIKTAINPKQKSISSEDSYYNETSAKALVAMGHTSLVSNYRNKQVNQETMGRYGQIYKTKILNEYAATQTEIRSYKLDVEKFISYLESEFMSFMQQRLMNPQTYNARTEYELENVKVELNRDIVLYAQAFMPYKIGKNLTELEKMFKSRYSDREIEYYKSWATRLYKTPLSDEECVQQYPLLRRKEACKVEFRIHTEGKNEQGEKTVDLKLLDSKIIPEPHDNAAVLVSIGSAEPIASGMNVTPIYLYILLRDFVLQDKKNPIEPNHIISTQKDIISTQEDSTVSEDEGDVREYLTTHDTEEFMIRNFKLIVGNPIDVGTARTEALDAKEQIKRDQEAGKEVKQEVHQKRISIIEDYEKYINALYEYGDDYRSAVIESTYNRYVEIRQLNLVKQGQVGDVCGTTSQGITRNALEFRICEEAIRLAKMVMKEINYANRDTYIDTSHAAADPINLDPMPIQQFIGDNYYVHDEL